MVMVIAEWLWQNYKQKVHYHQQKTTWQSSLWIWPLVFVAIYLKPIQLAPNKESANKLTAKILGLPLKYGEPQGPPEGWNSSRLHHLWNKSWSWISQRIERKHILNLPKEVQQHIHFSLSAISSLITSCQLMLFKCVLPIRAFFACNLDQEVLNQYETIHAVDTESTKGQCSCVMSSFSPYNDTFFEIRLLDQKYDFSSRWKIIERARSSVLWYWKHNKKTLVFKVLNIGDSEDT